MQRGLGLSWLLLALSVSLWGCGLVSDYHQCDLDGDCPRPADGARRYCTSDNLCVAGLPAERLCTEVYPLSPAPDALPIGVLMQLGSSPASDSLALSAVKLGVFEINQLTGVGARSFSLHICDVSTDAASGGADTTRKALDILLRKHRVAALLGLYSSPLLLDVAQDIAQAQVPFLTMATTSTLSMLPQRGPIFRTVPSDALLAKPLASQLVPPEGRVAILYADDAYGTSLKDDLLREWKQTPVMIHAFREGDQTQLGQAATAALGANLDSVVILSTADQPTLLVLLSGLPKNTRIYLSSTGRRPQVLGLAGASDPSVRDLFRRVYGVGPLTPTGGVARLFRSSFQAHFGADPLKDERIPRAYDGLYTLAIALGAAAASDGSLEGGDPRVTQALLGIHGTSMPVPLSGAGYLVAVDRATRRLPLSLEGAAGVIGFTATGDVESAFFERWIVQTDTQTGPFFESTAL